jgi:ZIP family zinc transporter
MGSTFDLGYYYPLLLGFIAGITVIFGAIPLLRARVGGEALAKLSLIASGILAYIALETGKESSETIEEMLHKGLLNDFLIAAVTTSAALLGTWILLSSIEREKGVATISKNSPLVIATALGVHNVGEGFAIASALLSGAVYSAIMFTTGFAIHNATEGFAIAAPGVLTRSEWIKIRRVLALALIAGLPTSLGASIYYLGYVNDIFFANLNTIATAALIYPMIRINLISASLLGGFNIKFWTFYFIGIALAYSLETVIILSMSI